MRIVIILLLSVAYCSGQVPPRVLEELLLTYRPPPAGGAWSPSDLGAELKVWLKNESLTGSDGDAVGYWADSSGNGNFATNSATNEQLYLTNSGSFGVGILSACIVAANDRLYLSNAVGVVRNVASSSVVMVLHPIDMSTARNQFIFARGTDTLARFSSYTRTTDDFVISGRRLDKNSSVSSDAVPNMGTAPIIVQWDADWGNASAYIWTNNILAVGDTSWLTSGNTEDTDSTIVMIGGNGWYAEMIVTVPRLSEANRTNVYNYLDAKFSF